MLSRNVLSSCRTARRVLHTTPRTLATLAEPSSSRPSPPPPAKIPTESKSQQVTLSAAVILNRSPIITPTPTAFERTYHAYHSRIKRALHNPFPYDFYFKQGSLLEGKFTAEEEEREREAFGSLRESPDAAESTDTQASRVGSELLGEEEAVKPMPRVSEADKTGDLKSLERKMERNLYLLLSAKDAAGKQVWRFPQGSVEKGEFLHETAQRELDSECGKAIDSWIVSRKPVGVYKPSETPEHYTFFYKAHILAGQVTPKPKNNTDFAWLTKEEIQRRVEKDYWLGIKDILSNF